MGVKKYMWACKLALGFVPERERATGSEIMEIDVAKSGG